MRPFPLVGAHVPILAPTPCNRSELLAPCHSRMRMGRGGKRSQNDERAEAVAHEAALRGLFLRLDRSFDDSPNAPLAHPRVLVANRWMPEAMVR